jgi:hypothetical protein
MLKIFTKEKQMKLTFTDLLTVLFIGLKLTGHITWSWLWVLSPLWIIVMLAIMLYAVLAMFGATDLLKR